jgi:hypothetical protein
MNVHIAIKVEIDVAKVITALTGLVIVLANISQYF